MNKTLSKIPDGWKELPDTTTNPRGYKWYWNGFSFFDNRCKVMLVKEENKIGEKENKC